MVDFLGFDGNGEGFDQGIFFAQVAESEDVSQSQSIDTVNIEQLQIASCDDVAQIQSIDEVSIIIQPVHDIEIDDVNQGNDIEKVSFLVSEAVDVTNNSQFLEGKPRGSVIINKVVDGINQLIQDKLVDGADDLAIQSSVRTATGVWLDHIGNRVKLPRPYVFADNGNWFGFDGNGVGFDQLPFTPGTEDGVPISDDAYRKLIILRGGQLLTDCSIPSMNAILEGAFESGHYIDNGDMTLDVILDTSLSQEIIIYTVEAGLITKPAGVRINEIYIQDVNGSFGFDGNGVGFDQGPFIQTYSDIAP